MKNSCAFPKSAETDDVGDRVVGNERAAESTRFLLKPSTWLAHDGDLMAMRDQPACELGDVRLCAALLGLCDEEEDAHTD